MFLFQEIAPIINVSLKRLCQQCSWFLLTVLKLALVERQSVLVVAIHLMDLSKNE